MRLARSNQGVGMEIESMAAAAGVLFSGEMNGRSVVCANEIAPLQTTRTKKMTPERK